MGSPSTAEPTIPRVLVTGATGYVGGRLWRRLREGGEVAVRLMARQPERLEGHVGERMEVVRADVMEPESLRRAMEGVDVAYYLVHAMRRAGAEFEAQEAEGARNFAVAAKAAGVKRLVYLGALAGVPGGDDRDDDGKLSPHLRSRLRVGRILRESGVPTIELRASIVLGSGSLSFELVRSLVERLPVMITPRWTTVEAQPVAVRDLLEYLEACLSLELGDRPTRIYEIGGADRTSYEGLMREYAGLRGHRRWMIRVPIVTPYLSSLWLGLVTPVYAGIGAKLIQSIRNPSVVRDDSALEAFPNIRPSGVREALERALASEERDFVETRWSDAVSSGGEIRSWGGVRFGNRIADSRTLHTTVSAERAFRPIRRIGGRTGWYAWDFLWSIRGGIDLLVGGVGTRRGRRSAEEISVGDALDFWRVEAYEPDRLLRLRAEMKLPGRAWLEFEVTPDADGGGSTVRQTALFDPLGLAGQAYWYSMYPLHAFVFRDMLRGIVRAAEDTGVSARGGAGVGALTGR